MQRSIIAMMCASYAHATTLEKARRSAMWDKPAHIVEQEKIAAEKLQNGSNPKNKFAASVYKMEIGRIRFVISSYLRVRLDKIQRFIFHQLEQEEKVRKKKIFKSDSIYLHTSFL